MYSKLISSRFQGLRKAFILGLEYDVEGEWPEVKSLYTVCCVLYIVRCILCTV